MYMRETKVLFEPAFQDADVFYDKPQPAARSIPEWYKKMPLTIDGTNAVRIPKDGSVNNSTLKGCSPFLDSLTAGYIMTTPCDIQVSKNPEENSLSFNWTIDLPGLVSSHDSRQVENIPPSSNFDGGALKWKAGWKMITPKGYSTLFTHPLNRDDLPFYTLSGIVETDTYGLATEFPFLMNTAITDNYFILPKGTPIVQAIPFKRDNWKSEYLEFDLEKNKRQQAKLRSTIVKSYKKNYWQNKKFL